MQSQALKIQEGFENLSYSERLRTEFDMAQ